VTDPGLQIDTGWSHAGVIAAFVIPLLIAFVGMWWDLRRRQLEMHEQNIDAGRERDRKLDFILVEHPMHSHDEDEIARRTGREEPLTLTTRGLSYPRTKFNRT
jgi:hypothetical protein